MDAWELTRYLEALPDALTCRACGVTEDDEHPIVIKRIELRGTRAWRMPMCEDSKACIERLKEAVGHG